MIVVSIVTILAALLTAHFAFVIFTIIKTHLAHEKIKKHSKGLKSCPGFNPLLGHIKSYVFRPNLSLQVKGLHDKLGKTFIVMMGSQPMCSSIDLDLISYIAISEPQQHTFRMWFSAPLKEFVEEGLLTTHNWRPIRKALSTALRPNRFKTPNVTKEINNSIGKLLDSIERKLDENNQQTITIDADDHFHRYSLDLVLNCFYKQDNLVDYNAKEDNMVNLIERGLSNIFSNPLVAYTVVFDYLNPVVDWFVLNFTQIGSWRKQIMNFIKIQTKLNIEARKEMERRAKLEGKSTTTMEVENVTLKDGRTFNRNMIDSFIDEYLAGKLNSKQFFHNAFFLFGAADKTSGDALASCLHYLALNQDKQEKLRQDIRLNGVKSEYLMWVVNETLRLSPSVPLGCSRTIERDIEVEQGRYVVPKGTCVLTPLYAIHRLKEYWGDDADEFKPERFAQQKSFHPCQFMPFGAGLRGCPGKEFALHEMKMVLTELVSRYKFSGKPKQDDGFDSPFYIFLIPYEHIMLQVSRVEPK